MSPMEAEVSAAALQVDVTLAEVAASFDYLLYVSPTNSDEAWQRFEAGGSSEPPQFTYRYADVDVDGLRHQLADAPVAEIDDDAIARLLEGKRQELYGYLDLLATRGTPAFLQTSIAMSGTVDDALTTLAEQILTWVADAEADPEPTIPPEAFVARAEEEIAAYRRQDPALTASVELRSDIVALMVSRNQLFVPAGRHLPPVRVEPLIHHEVGTHLLTWWNGHCQPLRMLADGLGGYQEAQEGLGVLAEHLAGGLTPTRLGELAARVVAARSVIDGASFLDTFTDLHETRGLAPQRAFDLAERVHRGGGLVKDAAYLRGLVRLIAYLQAGGEMDPLLAGKPALDDLDDVAGLLARGVLVKPRLQPHWLDGDGAARLAALRDAPDATTVLLP